MIHLMVIHPLLKSPTEWLPSHKPSKHPTWFYVQSTSFIDHWKQQRKARSQLESPTLPVIVLTTKSWVGMFFSTTTPIFCCSLHIPFYLLPLGGGPPVGQTGRGPRLWSPSRKNLQLGSQLLTSGVGFSFQARPCSPWAAPGPRLIVAGALEPDTSTQCRVLDGQSLLWAPHWVVPGGQTCRSLRPSPASFPFPSLAAAMFALRPEAFSSQSCCCPLVFHRPHS